MLGLVKTTVLVALFASSQAIAQKVEVSSKGAQEPEQIVNGEVSFEKKTNKLTVQADGKAAVFDPKTEQIVITFATQDKPVPGDKTNGYGTPGSSGSDSSNGLPAAVKETEGTGASSKPTSPRDVLTMKVDADRRRKEEEERNVQKATVQPDTPPIKDLRKCPRRRTIDRVIVKPNESGGQASTFEGKLVSISGGDVEFTVGNDSDSSIFRMDEVFTITISVCQ
jgi:hypothetical protein